MTQSDILQHLKEYKNRACEPPTCFAWLIAKFVMQKLDKTLKLCQLQFCFPAHSGLSEFPR